MDNHGNTAKTDESETKQSGDRMGDKNKTGRTLHIKNNNKTKHNKLIMRMKVKREQTNATKRSKLNKKSNVTKHTM